MQLSPNGIGTLRPCPCLGKATFFPPRMDPLFLFSVISDRNWREEFDCHRHNLEFFIMLYLLYLLFQVLPNGTVPSSERIRL